MGKLVGYRRFTSKKGTDCCIANIVSDYNGREKEMGAVGEKTEEIFVPASQYNLLQPSDIGCEIVLNYEFSGNRAFLNEIVVKRKK